MALPHPDWRPAGPADLASYGHDLVAWKYHHVGNYLLNGVLPPDRRQI